MKRILYLGLLCLVAHLGIAQDTFSIVALDEETGEIGSAGASCVEGAAQLGGVILISDIIPGRGAINGQATVCIPHINLENGISQMEAGASPQEVLDWLYENDDCIFGTNEDRQYGIVDFDMNGNPRSAAFTGMEALDYAGHRIGSNYAIQGNILLGPEILDSMETRFLNAQGSLAERLMEALQGANVPGADSRCLSAGTSSTSAFLQVYQPDDEAENPSLRLNVAETATGVEPIDSLQVLFNDWIITSAEELNVHSKINVFPNPAKDYLYIDNPQLDALQLNLYDLNGQLVQSERINGTNQRIDLSNIRCSGIILYQIMDNEERIQTSGKLFVQKSD